MSIQERSQANRIEQVNIRKPSASELRRVIEFQMKQEGRTVTCVKKTFKDAAIHQTLNLQDRRGTNIILSLLNDLRSDAETVEQVIIYNSSTKD